MDSILGSVKESLGGLTEDVTDFDNVILDHINMAFATLLQFGIGPENGFFVSDKTTTWSSFTEEERIVPLAKMYVFKKVKLEFDPPTSGPAIEALKTALSELEWRLTNAKLINADTQ